MTCDRANDCEAACVEWRASCYNIAKNRGELQLARVVHVFARAARLEENAHGENAPAAVVSLCTQRDAHMSHTQLEGLHKSMH